MLMRHSRTLAQASGYSVSSGARPRRTVAMRGGCGIRCRRGWGLRAGWVVLAAGTVLAVGASAGCGGSEGEGLPDGTYEYVLTPDGSGEGVAVYGPNPNSPVRETLTGTVTR
jgi:hypothetical protein